MKEGIHAARAHERHLLYERLDVLRPRQLRVVVAVEGVEVRVIEAYRLEQPRVKLHRRFDRRLRHDAGEQLRHADEQRRQDDLNINSTTPMTSRPGTTTML